MPFKPGNVRAEIARAGLTQVEVARRSEGRVSRGAIGEACTAGGNPTVGTLDAIARICGCDPVAFYGAAEAEEEVEADATRRSA